MSAISVSWLNVSWGAVYIETNYGLMQHSYIEITNKLLGALDSEYNVVDMPTVFDVVAVLERTPITPEVLETTRLGRYINECRKKTSNEVLARRAKLLLRQWRNMMITPATTNRSASNTLSPATTNRTTSAGSTVSPTARVIPPSSVPQQNGTNVRSSLQRPDRIVTPSVSPALAAPSTSGRSSNIYDRVSPSSLSPGRDPKVESVPKTHVANKRLRKTVVAPLSPPAFGEPPAKASKVNGTMFVEKHDSPPSARDSEDYSRVREQTPNVAVDEDSPSTSGLTTVVTESVPEPDPALPKKRSRKKANKKKLSEDDIVKEKLVAMSKTVRVKTTEELVADLKSRTEDRLMASTSTGMNSVKPSLSNNVRPDDATESKAESSKDERLDPEARVERDIAEIMSKLPPLNVDEINWESPEPSPPSSPQPVTEQDVDRYLDQHWDGVNGCATHSVPVASTSEQDSFREWHEVVSRRTINDDMIHILPYSIVD